MLNVVSRIDNTCKPYLYRGEDCLKQFVEQLTEIKKDIFEKMNVNKPIDELTNEQKLELKLSSHCSICGKKLMMRKSATTATSQANTEAQRM